MRGENGICPGGSLPHRLRAEPPRRLPLRGRWRGAPEGENLPKGTRERICAMLYYNRKNVPLAKQLRRDMTPWERKLWYQFLRTFTPRFQRQKSIGGYIADFYCAKTRLVIELDGAQHYTPAQRQADSLRTEFFAQNHIRVLRFTNLDIDRRFDGVCQTIEAAVQAAV